MSYLGARAIICCCLSSEVGADGVPTYDKPGAVVNLVVGSAGAGFTKNAVGAPFSEVVFYEYGYLRVTAVNRTHLSCEFQEAQDGKGVLDRFVIVQEDWEAAAAGAAAADAASDAASDASSEARLQSQNDELRKSVVTAGTVAALEGAALIGMCVFALMTWRKMIRMQKGYYDAVEASGGAGGAYAPDESLMRDVASPRSDAVNGNNV